MGIRHAYEHCEQASSSARIIIMKDINRSHVRWEQEIYRSGCNIVASVNKKLSSAREAEEGQDER